MYCPSCGKSVDANVHFCPNCGTAMTAGATTYPPPPPPFSQPMYSQPMYPAARLVRPRESRMIAGVCAAFALQYGWDISLVRILTAVLAILTSGVAGLAYLAAWIIIPEAPYLLPPGGAYAAPTYAGVPSSGVPTVSPAGDAMSGPPGTSTGTPSA